MQFSLNKLHFPDEKSASFSPAPSAPAKFFAPPTRFGWWGEMADFGDGGGAGPIRPPPMYAPGGLPPWAWPPKLYSGLHLHKLSNYSSFSFFDFDQSISDIL